MLLAGILRVQINDVSCLTRKALFDSVCAGRFLHMVSQRLTKFGPSLSRFPLFSSFVSRWPLFFKPVSYLYKKLESAFPCLFLLPTHFLPLYLLPLRLIGQVDVSLWPCILLLVSGRIDLTFLIFLLPSFLD